MNDTRHRNTLEGLKLISDWAKWLITIETGGIAVIGAIIKIGVVVPYLVSVLATGAIICFLISIASAAVLLLTLPEITQTLRPDTNIWLTRDSIAGRLLKMDTQALAVAEAFFFGLGTVCFSAMMIAVVWSPTATPLPQNP